ncbi:MAG: c-type cytochrome, partial [Planctomycetota bacterium]
IALLLSRPTWTKPLLAEISQGRVAATELDLPQQQALLDHSDETIRAAAAISFQRRTSAARQEILSRYTAALSDQGDPAGGRRIYQKHCSVCHRIQDAGQNVGPEIQTYGSKPPSSLLVATLDPNQAVDPRYQSFVAVRKDGRSVTGMIAEEASASLTLLASEGKREVIPRTEIDEIRGTGKSLMPEGFEQQLSPQDLNDLIAWFRTLRQPPKSLEGNRPALVRIPSEGNAALQASQSEIYGGDITFELPFQNIGFWHGADDQIRWQVRAEKSRMMDVWAEWACAEDAQGNGYVLEGFEPVLRGAVGGTGGWHEYKLVPLGQVTIREGDSEVILRPSAAPRSALVDLRAVHLVAPGGVPLARGNAQRSRNENVTGKSLEDIVAFLLNDSMPAADRDVMMSASLNHASELISLMTSGLQGDPGGEEEYRRIPWIWRVAIAVGKSRDDAKIRSVLRVSLPGPDAALSHWQAVVIGGGLINGITLAGRWPDEVMGRIVDTDPDLKHAWQRVLKLSTTMVDDESVPRGTRYDALRMIALRDWTQIKPVFQKYLEKGIDEELQMGAVSGVCDARHDSEVVDLLTASFGCLSESNMKLAVEGLMRNPERIRRLKELNSVGKLSQTLLDHPALKDVLAR